MQTLHTMRSRPSNSSHHSRYSARNMAKPTNFFCAAPEAQSVAVVGDFNDMGTPIIEIANHGNRLRLRRRAEEVGRLGHVSGRVTAVVGAVRRSRTHCMQRLHLVIILNPWGKAFTGLTAIENQNSARSASGKPRKMKIFLQQFVDKDVAQSRLGPWASTLVRRRHLLYVQRNAR